MSTTPQGDFRRGVQVRYLRAWRMHRLLSQAELSDRARLSVQGISAAEHGGRVRLGTLSRLAQALGVDREALVRIPPPGDAHEEDTNHA